MLLSELFNISPVLLTEKGVFNANVAEDSQLHIDPSLLKECSIPEFEHSYENFTKYFSDVFVLAGLAGRNDRAGKQLVESLKFREIVNTGLGYSKNHKSGTGIGEKLAKQIASSVIELYSLGIDDPVVFEIMPFFEENIGADRISDMTAYILVEDFLLYTQRVCNELGIPMSPSVRYEAKCYDLPQNNGQGIIFVPYSILCDLPKANDWDEIGGVSSYNTALRRRICQLIGVNMTEARKLPKHKIKEILLNNSSEFADFIQEWKTKKHISYVQTCVKDDMIIPQKTTIFISYSWDDENHKAWVKKLADSLKSHGLSVSLDQYLPKGSSLSSFMMDGIKKADKVLVIGTPVYKERAEKYIGGTNVEHQIINIQIGKQFDTTKFIPVLRKGTYDTSFTDLIGDRLGYDFRDDSKFESLILTMIEDLKKVE